MARSGKALMRVRSVSIAQSRSNLAAVADAVRRGKAYVVLKRGGKAVAAVMDIDEFEDYLELHDPHVHRFIAASRKQFEAGLGEPAEDILERRGRRRSSATKAARRLGLR